MPLPDDLAWRLIETMLLMRRFEESVLRMSAEKQFVGHYHLYIGQEATGAAVMSVLEPRDRLTTTHRNHGHVIARGADPGRAMAEILGRATGLNGGRGGTIHLSDPDLGFLSTSGIVGGCIGLGVGGGYACKQKADGSVSATFFGDGALEEGVSFEALEHRRAVEAAGRCSCARTTAPARGRRARAIPTLVHASSDLRLIPQSVGITTVRVDGADAAAVHAAASDAVARCRRGEGPVFIEAMTRRWPGNNPLWPEPVTGVTDLAHGDRRAQADHRRARRLAREGTTRCCGSRVSWYAAGRRRRASRTRSTRGCARASMPPCSFALEEPAAGRSDRLRSRLRLRNSIMPKNSFAQALVDGLYDSLAADPRVSLIGSYVLGLGPQRHLMDRLRKDFRDRVVDPPTSEAGSAATGIGAAMAGMRPFVDLGTASFSYLAWSQVINEAAVGHYMSGGRTHRAGNLPSAARRARRRRLPAQQQPAVDDVQRARARDRGAVDRGGCLWADPRRLRQLQSDGGGEPRQAARPRERVPEKMSVVPIGCAEVKRAGRAVTIVANSLMTHYSLLAAERLAADGIDAEVVDLRSLAPLDEDTILASVGKTGRLVVVDECPLRCGIASEIAASVAERGFNLLRAPIVRVTRAQVPVPYSGPLEAAIVPSADSIAAAVRKAVR